MFYPFSSQTEMQQHFCFALFGAPWLSDHGSTRVQAAILPGEDSFSSSKSLPYPDLTFSLTFLLSTILAFTGAT